jgi:hypothetical protein
MGLNAGVRRVGVVKWGMQGSGAAAQRAWGVRRGSMRSGSAARAGREVQRIPALQPSHRPSAGEQRADAARPAAPARGAQRGPHIAHRPEQAVFACRDRTDSMQLGPVPSPAWGAGPGRPAPPAPGASGAGNTLGGSRGACRPPAPALPDPPSPAPARRRRRRGVRAGTPSATTDGTTVSPVRGCGARGLERCARGRAAPRCGASRLSTTSRPPRRLLHPARSSPSPPPAAPSRWPWRAGLARPCPARARLSGEPGKGREAVRMGRIAGRRRGAVGAHGASRWRAAEEPLRGGRCGVAGRHAAGRGGAAVMRGSTARALRRGRGLCGGSSAARLGAER